MNKAFFLSIILITAIAGCMQNSSSPAPEIKYGMSEHYNMSSHQYTSVAPMGMGNNSDLVINGTNQSVVVNVSVESFFHQPLLWNQGFVNISILDENDTILWQNQTTGFENWSVVLSDNFSHNGNLTFRILSEGSDNATDTNVGDWYAIEFNTTCQWIEP